MQVKIVREISLSGSYFFMVYADDNLIQSFSYHPNVPINDIYNEDKNYEAALLLAKYIESGKATITETIYETPKDNAI